MPTGVMALSYENLTFELMSALKSNTFDQNSMKLDEECNTK